MAIPGNKQQLSITVHKAWVDLLKDQSEKDQAAPEVTKMLEAIFANGVYWTPEQWAKYSSLLDTGDRICELSKVLVSSHKEQAETIDLLIEMLKEYAGHIIYMGAHLIGMKPVDDIDRSWLNKVLSQAINVHEKY